jgi:C1A family cysteine protease
MLTSKVLTIILIGYALSFPFGSKTSFNQFSDKFNKDYESKMQEVMASFFFKRNNAILEDLKNMNLPFKVGITKFHDMSSSDFKNKYLTFTPDKEDFMGSNGASFLEISAESFKTEGLPTSVDWRIKNILTPIREQGTCGGCWAFSTVSNIETMILKKYGQTVDLSEQSFINCVSRNVGCSGGNMKNALIWAQGINGLISESSQPYQSTTLSCDSTGVDNGFKVASYSKLATIDEDKIAAFIVMNGPVSAALNANSLQFYHSGIYDIPDCDVTQTNHAVNIVGYGVENGKPYWIIRNSWGADWGENGYFRIARGKNMCGISSYIITAVLA